MNIRPDGKRALVPAGNSGIGAAIVPGLAEAGAKVAINCVTQQGMTDDSSCAPAG